MELSIGILMADLSGFTAMTEVHGDIAAKTIIERYISIAKDSLSGEAHLLERSGDQLMIISRDPDDLATTAIQLRDRTRAEPHFLDVHAGLHFGPVVEESCQFFGATVNLAARIAAKARQGRILCSSEFVDAMSEAYRFRTIPAGNFRLRNVLEAKQLYELLPLQEQGHPLYTDPVCHIHLHADELHHTYYDGEKLHYFCSLHCKEIFMEQTAVPARMAV